MDREAIVNRIGAEYHTVNVEHEWSYIADAGNKETLLTRLGDAAYNKILSLGDGALHFLLDIRFVCGNTAILIETKQKATEADSKQLACYCMEEHALHPEHNVVGILADIQGDHISVWKNQIDDAHFLKDETALQKIAPSGSTQEYLCLFVVHTFNFLSLAFQPQHRHCLFGDNHSLALITVYKLIQAYG